MIFEDIKKEYETGKYWGLSSTIDLFNCDQDKIIDEVLIVDFVIALCDSIDMKRYGECRITPEFGEGDKAGLSMLQFIETSHIAGHFAKNINCVYLDVFSCKIYNPYAVGKFAIDFFGAQNVRVGFQFREYSNVIDF